jgi:transcriptional regulator with XRE-family HTH domain
VPALPPSRPPSARARRLAAELRQLRESLGRTGEDVASALGWSASKVSRIETSRTAVSLGDLRSLLDLYHVSGSTRDRLTELGRTANQRGWWEAYGDTLGFNYSTFIALEEDAESERFYGQMFVPGILQTSRYAEEIIRVGFLAAPPGEIARRMQARLTRQRLLTRDAPLQLRVILDEGALQRQVGGQDVMAEQISHLIDMAGNPNIIMQILPFSAGAHIAVTGSFTLLTFPGPTVSQIVYLENLTDELFIEGEAQAYQYSLAFDRLSELALGPEDSISFAAQVARAITQQRRRN